MRIPKDFSKCMFDRVRIVFVIAALLALGATAMAGPVIYSHDWNFDASDADPVAGFFQFAGTAVTPGMFEFQGGAGLHTAGKDGILGPFGNDSYNGIVQEGSAVTLTVGDDNGPEMVSFSLTFQLWIINTWDGNGGFYNNFFFGPDVFRVALGTQQTQGCTVTDLHCETFGMGPHVDQNHPVDNSPSGTTASYYQYNGGNLQAMGNFTFDMSAHGYSVYTITIDNFVLDVPTNKVTILFHGLQGQEGYDESWALGAVSFTAEGEAVPDEVPEPGTIGLLLLGIAIMFARRRLAGAKIRA